MIKTQAKFLHFYILPSRTVSPPWPPPPPPPPWGHARSRGGWRGGARIRSPGKNIWKIKSVKNHWFFYAVNSKEKIGLHVVQGIYENISFFLSETHQQYPGAVPLRKMERKNKNAAKKPLRNRKWSNPYFFTCWYASSPAKGGASPEATDRAEGVRAGRPSYMYVREQYARFAQKIQAGWSRKSQLSMLPVTKT